MLPRVRWMVWVLVCAGAAADVRMMSGTSIVAAGPIAHRRRMAFSMPLIWAARLRSASRTTRSPARRMAGGGHAGGQDADADGLHAQPLRPGQPLPLPAICSVPRSGGLEGFAPAEPALAALAEQRCRPPAAPVAAAQRRHRPASFP